jgi:hypothetical protein
VAVGSISHFETMSASHDSLTGLADDGQSPSQTEVGASSSDRAPALPASDEMVTGLADEQDDSHASIQTSSASSIGLSVSCLASIGRSLFRAWLTGGKVDSDESDAESSLGGMDVA